MTELPCGRGIVLSVPSFHRRPKPYYEALIQLQRTVIMFWRTKNAGGSDFHESSLNEQSESFLRHHDPRLALRLPPSTNVLWPWVLSTSFFAILSLALLTFQVVPSRTGSYEVGFDTELGPYTICFSDCFTWIYSSNMLGSTGTEPAKVAIAIEKVKFHGGIIVNETGHFNLISDPHGPKYTGHPTRELDAAWDSLVGKSSIHCTWNCSSLTS